MEISNSKPRPSLHILTGSSVDRPFRIMTVYAVLYCTVQCKLLLKVLYKPIRDCTRFAILEFEATKKCPLMTIGIWLSITVNHHQKLKIILNNFLFVCLVPLKLDILARTSSRLEFQFSILFFTIRRAVLIFLFSV